MATQWLYRINVIIPAADTAAYNALWTIVAPGGDAEAQTFGVPLSEDGLEPVTHYGISTAATAQMASMIAALDDVMTGAIVGQQDYIGNDWEKLLTDNGLQIVATERL